MKRIILGSACFIIILAVFHYNFQSSYYELNEIAPQTVYTEIVDV